MNWSRTKLIPWICVVTLSVAPASAQKTSGTIRGLVTDPSGAVVPSVTVVIRNNGTGTARTVTTSIQGEYVVPELPAGTYTITVNAPGFKEASSSTTVLHVSSTEVLNFQLQVGSASEQVLVNANAVQVQVDNAALGEVVTGEQVSELPLNGRSFVMLTQLVPGVSAANDLDTKNKGLLTGVDFSVNGNATTSNLFLVDGANDNDVGSNRTILIYPSIEAISELKMVRNSYGAEYGQASGAIINIVTRSGSNQWHGDVLYFGRNDALNAYEYFAAATEVQARAQGTTLPNGGKDLLRRNDFGYSLGGPIKKDKLFFFLSQEWNIERRGQTRQSCVPTAAERAGDFTNTSCGEPQPTGLVAAGLANPNTPYIMNSISPAGSLLAAELPLPNLAIPLPSGANWSESVTTPIDWSQFNVRLDYNISHSQTLMFRFTKDNWTNNSPNGNAALGLWGDDPYPVLESNWAQPSKQIVARLTAAIGTSMVNDLEFAYSDNRINITAGGTDPGLLAQTTAAIPPGWPEKYKTSKLGIPTLWSGLNGYTSYNNITLIAPWRNSLDIYTVRDDFSKVIGAQTLRFGAFLGWNGKNEYNGSTGSTEYPQFSSNDGSTSIPTGNDLANVLAPRAQWFFSEQSTNTYVHLRWRDYELYAADNWKLRPNLTVDLGLRYSILAPPFQPNNQFTSFRPELYNPDLPSSDACNGLVTVPGYSPCANANKVFGTNFTEAAAGQNRYLKDVDYHLFAPRLGVSWDPTGSGNNAIRAGFGIFYQRDRTTPSYINAANAPFALNATFIRTLDAQPAISIPAGSTSPAGGFDPSYKVPNSLQWNLAAEHSFARNTTLEVAYVGNHAIHQLNNYDVNYVPQSQWINAAFQPFGLDYLRRFSGWTAMTWWVDNGDANYNSLQVLFKTQIQTFQLQAAYTWSHSIGNVTNQNSNGASDFQSYTWGPNPGLDRGNTLVNRPQIFVANAIYYLPSLRGSNSFVQATFGGWELAVISQYSSGASTTLYQYWFTDLANGNTVGLIGSGNPQARPLTTATPCKGVGGPEVLNPDSVSMIGYQIGTIPKGIEPRGYCRGPGYVNTDFSVDKNWRLWHEKLRLQFRLDFFNLFNHPNFRGDFINQGPVYGNGNCGAPDSSGAYAPCSPTNNIVTRQSVQSGMGYSTLTKGPREIQYGLKLIF